MTAKKFTPLNNYKEYPVEEMLKRSRDFHEDIKRRRTVREFSNKTFPTEIIENCLRSAGTAPSGANFQPWHFVLISDKKIKHETRIAAEKEEKEFYSKRAPKEWLEALTPLSTDENKPFLEDAPYIIAVFSKSYDVLPGGEKVKQYYSMESVGIACGILITAIHQAGLVSLTYTPSPMNFLNKILDRPKNEKPFLLLVVGYPAENTKVPNITKKELNEIVTYK